MPTADQAVPDGFAVRANSGIVVPAHIMAVRGAQAGDAAAVDPDGRRRVVISDSDRRIIQRAVRVLAASGITVLLRCNESRPKQRVGVPPPCGALLKPEGQDTHDHGFGCDCSRIHLA